MPLTALITRPEEDARPLAEALAARGVATVIEPLLAIRPLPEAASDLAKDLAGVQALLFTSANGARAFAELSPRRDIGVLAVGDATASAARGLGFTAVESAGGDVQGLARLVKQRLKPAGGPLLHAAGSAVAGDLAETLAADGFDLRRRMLYESATATALSPETIAALKQGRIDLVLLFSPRTAVTFAELARAAAVDASELTALCLSPAVATAVSGLAWKKVEVAEKPDLASLLALVDKRLAAPTSAAPTPGVASAAASASSSTASSSGASTSVFPATPFTAASAMESNSAPLGASSPDRSPPSAPGAPIPTIVPLPRRSGGSALLAGLIGAVIAAAAVVAVMRYAPDKMGLAPAGAAPAAVAARPGSEAATGRARGANRGPAEAGQRLADIRPGSGRPAGEARDPAAAGGGAAAGPRRGCAGRIAGGDRRPAPASGGHRSQARRPRPAAGRAGAEAGRLAAGRRRGCGSGADQGPSSIPSARR